jgi:hypothetical protein
LQSPYFFISYFPKFHPDFSIGYNLIIKKLLNLRIFSFLLYFCPQDLVCLKSVYLFTGGDESKQYPLILGRQHREVKEFGIAVEAPYSLHLV